MAPRNDLNGRRILVVGAAGGIGSATCRELLKRGARIAGIDRQLPPGGEGDLAAIEYIQADITERTAVERAVARAIEKLGGGLDILINVAGVGLPQDAGALPGEDVTLTLEVNLLGPWTVTACALQALLASHGRVINVASGLAFANVPFSAAYAASKRALAAWSDVLRLEYGSQISVTTIYPGYVRTPIHAASEAAGLSLDDLVREEPLQAVALTLVRACTGRPKRDMATTRLGGFEIGLARHFPALVDAIILGRLRRLARKQRYERSPLALGMLKRLEMRES